MNASPKFNVVPRFDKTIPMPAAGTKQKSPWPLDGMEVGDSYLFEGETDAPRLRNRLSYGMLKRGWKIAFRTDPTGTGIRAWRVA